MEKKEYKTELACKWLSKIFYPYFMVMTLLIKYATYLHQFKFSLFLIEKLHRICTGHGNMLPESYLHVNNGEEKDFQ